MSDKTTSGTLFLFCTIVKVQGYLRENNFVPLWRENRTLTNGTDFNLSIQNYCIAGGLSKAVIKSPEISFVLIEND